MTARKKLRVALTPCPNDTFVIGAVATGKIKLANADIELELHDIEYLNRAALDGGYDIIKVSCANYARLAADYEILNTGAALVDANGPLVLARESFTVDEIRTKTFVAPGAHTTATMLLKRWAGPGAQLSFAPYDQITDHVKDGEYDAGVIIHEGRFTFKQQGLTAIVDLGDWWRVETGRPLALGCYLIRRELADEFSREFDALLREGMLLATDGDPGIDNFIQIHAQEMDQEVIRKHIDLYVNKYTHDLGESGREAIQYLANCWQKQRVSA